MHLVSLRARGFRSLKEIEVTFQPLTVLIGENDAGKSSVLDLLEIFLTLRLPDEQDFYRDLPGNICEEIEVELDFELGEGDTEAKEYASDNRLRIRKVYRRPELQEETYYWGEQPTDERLRQDFGSLRSQEQKDLIWTLDPEVSEDEISNADKRTEWFRGHMEQTEKESVWILADRRLGSILPHFERYSAMDYQNPESLIVKTLKQSYERTIYEDVPQPDGTQIQQLIEPLLRVQEEAKEQIRQDISVLKAYIQKYDQRVQSIDYEPAFDFTSSLRTGEFQLDSGRGLHALSRTGDGTKRRMFMGIMDWDREISLEQARSGGKQPLIIRGYDEPDTNLHYEAQQLMYQAIEEIATSEGAHIQAVLCTHSLTMINRAPAQSIRLLRLCDAGYTTLEQLKTDEDPEVERFLSTLARELGITNTLIFYERCFVLIEGETEENALPIFYRTLYGRSLLEDGIQIINVRGKGAVKEFLRLMSRNRQEATIIFLDRDAEHDSTATLTKNTLRDAGFDESFITNRLLYIGDEEFEDAFDDGLLADCLQHYWPKANGCWDCMDIACIRTNGKKFSDGLTKAVAENRQEDGSYLRKPEFGQKLAHHCCSTDVPPEICDLFDLAQEIAGVAPPAA